MEKLIVSSSPHVHSGASTPRIMRDVLIALAPCCVAAVVLFRLAALWVLLTCVITCVLSEYIFTLILKKPTTVGDLSAAVTGVLLGLNMSSDTPLWQCAVTAVFSIVVVKCLFGGLGHNFANPAITGRVFMLISFSATVPQYVVPSFTSADLVTSATPLELMKNGRTDALPELWKLLVGLHGGAIGETCAVAILLGFAYLVVRRVIHWEVPTALVLTVFLLSWAITGDMTLALYYVLSGGLLLGAVFMATDYVTTPLTKAGKLLFAVGVGLVTVLIRVYGSYPEGMSFAILLMNILSPYLEKWTTPKPHGGKKA